MKKILKYFKNMSTMQLTGVIAFVAILVLYATVPIKNSSLGKRYEFLTEVIAALGFYIGGCFGLVCIIRREYIMPFGRLLKGNFAILVGVLILLGSWGIATMFLLFIWI